MDQMIERVLKNLEKRKINAKYFENKEAVKKEILDQVKADMTVGIGGSMSIKEMNLHEDLI